MIRGIVCADKRDEDFDSRIVFDLLKILRKNGIHEVGYLGFRGEGLKKAVEYQRLLNLNLQSMDTLDDRILQEWKGSSLVLSSGYLPDEGVVQKMISVKAQCAVMGRRKISSEPGDLLVFRKKVLGIFPDTGKKESPVFIPAVKMDHNCTVSAVRLLQQGFELKETVNRLLKTYDFTYTEYHRPEKTYGSMAADSWKTVLEQMLQKYRPDHAQWFCDIPDVNEEFQGLKELYKCCFDGRNPAFLIAAGSRAILREAVEYQEQMIADRSGWPILVLLPSVDALEGLYAYLGESGCQADHIYLCADLWMKAEQRVREECIHRAFCHNMSVLTSEETSEEESNVCIRSIKKLLSNYYHQNDSVRAGNLFQAAAAAEECRQSVKERSLSEEESTDTKEYWSEIIQKRVTEAYGTTDFQTARRRHDFILNLLNVSQKSVNPAEETLNGFRRMVLEILGDIQSFCRQKKIACFLADATLLGAWRNERWVPWSNNTVRLYMPRRSYDRFLKHAAGCLRRKYRLDTAPVSGSKVFPGTRVILDDSRYESEFWPGTKSLRLPHVEIMPYETVNRRNDCFEKEVLSGLNERVTAVLKEEKKQRNAVAVEEYMRSLCQEEGEWLLFWDFDVSRGIYVLEEKALQKRAAIRFCGLECRTFKNAEILLRRRYGGSMSTLPGVKKDIISRYAEAELPAAAKEQRKIRKAGHAGVTVIVPVYNTRQYLDRCLLSLVNQSLEELEILVIDDGSTDGSAELLNQWEEAYPERIRVIHQENAGVSKARMRGIREAARTWLGFVDSDDYVERNMYELLVEKAEEDQAEVVVCRYYRENDVDGQYYMPGKWDCWQYGGNVEESPGILLTARPFSWTKLFQKELVEKNCLEFPDFRLGEDSAFVIPALLMAERVSIVDAPLYHYIVDRQDSALHSYQDQRLRDIFGACDYILDWCRACGKWKRLEAELTEYLRRVLTARFQILRKIQDTSFLKAFIKESFRYMDQKLPQWNQTVYYQEACREAASSDDPYDLARMTEKGMEAFFFGEPEMEKEMEMPDFEEKTTGFWKRLFKDR